MDVDRDLDFLKTTIEQAREAGEDEWLAARFALTCILNTNLAHAWDEGYAALGADYMREYDARVEGEPFPHPTLNPHAQRVEYTEDLIRRRLA